MIGFTEVTKSILNDHKSFIEIIIEITDFTKSILNDPYLHIASLIGSSYRTEKWLNKEHVDTCLWQYCSMLYQDLPVM